MSNFSLAGVGEFSKDYASDKIFEKLIICEYINNVMDELEPLERDTILLFFFNHMSTRDIGKFLDKPKSTIHAAKTSGVKKLFFLIMADKGLLESKNFFKDLS